MPGEPRHPLVQGRVSGEVDARRSLDQESERARVTVERPSRMASRDRGHANRAELDAVVGGDLADLATVAGRAPAQATGHDDQRATRDRAQGRTVEMVGVAVRDQDGIDRAQAGGIRRRPKPAEGTQPCSEDGVGEDAHAVELDQDRGVADVRQPQGAPHGRPQPGRSLRSPSGSRQPRRLRAVRARGTRVSVNSAPIAAPRNPSARSAIVSS